MKINISEEHRYTPIVGIEPGKCFEQCNEYRVGYKHLFIKINDDKAIYKAVDLLNGDVCDFNSNDTMLRIRDDLCISKVQEDK